LLFNRENSQKYMLTFDPLWTFKHCLFWGCILSALNFYIPFCHADFLAAPQRLPFKSLHIFSMPHFTWLSLHLLVLVFKVIIQVKCFLTPHHQDCWIFPPNVALELYICSAKSQIRSLFRTLIIVHWNSFACWIVFDLQWHTEDLSGHTSPGLLSFGRRSPPHLIQHILQICFQRQAAILIRPCLLGYINWLGSEHWLSENQSPCFIPSAILIGSWENNWYKIGQSEAFPWNFPTQAGRGHSFFT
jgi:hypothetical protein